MLNSFLIDFVIVSVIFWVAVALFHFIKTRHFRLAHFDFNRDNYCILIMPPLISILLVAIRYQSSLPLGLFLIFGIAGMVGETIFSIWWKIFFEKNFWIYRFDTLFNGYTSTLNFVLWGMGGLLLAWVGEKVGISHSPGNGFLSVPLIATYIFLFFVGLTLFVSYHIGERRKIGFQFKELNFFSYLLFCMPILAVIVYLAYVDILYLRAAIFFGLIAFIFEYLLGKVIEFFISKELWYYSYGSFDHKHSTFLNILPFILGGFYFWFFYILALQVIS